MKLYKALLTLEKVCPDLFSIMKAITIDPVKDENGMTAFAAKTRNGYRIGINENWIETFDTFNLAAILEHELLHIVLDHLKTMAEVEDPSLANDAQDFIINDIGTFLKDRSKLNETLNKGLFIADLNKAFNTNFNSQKNTSKEIYEFLLEQKKKNPQKSKIIGVSFDKGLDESQNEKDMDDGEGGDNGTISDVAQALGLAPKDPEKEGEGNKTSDKESRAGGQKAERNGIKVERGELPEDQTVSEGDSSQGLGGGMLGGLDGHITNDQLKNIIKQYSKSSAEVRLYFDQIEKLAKNKIIKNEIEKFFSSAKEMFRRSFKKPNKRFPNIPFGRIPDRTQTCLLALDVSGSMMSKEDLEKLKMSVSSATGNGFKVDLIFGDTQKLGGFKDIQKNFDFSKIHGGGGTSLGFIFEEAVRDYDVIVVVTDGYFDHDEIPDKLRGKILFLITGRYNQHVPGFKNVNI